MRFEGLADLALHQQHHVGRELRQAAADQSQEVCHLDDALAARMPGRIRRGKPQLLRQAQRHGAALQSERCQRADGAAELKRERAPTDLGEPLEMIEERREPHRAFVAEGDGERVLQMGAPGHHRVAMRFSLCRKPGGDVAELFLDEREAVPHLQDERAVHDVLRGGAPMDIARAIAAGSASQRLHQPDHGIADDAGAFADVVERDAFEHRRRADRRSGRGRDDAELGLDPGQRRLDIEHLLHEAALVEDTAHRVAAEEAAEDDRIRGIDAHQRSKNAVSPSPCSTTSKR